MSTTLIAAMQELSKQIGDSWQSTTTGAGGTTTLVDTALIAKQNDWVTKDTWAFLTEEPTGDAAIYDERLVSSLANSTGTLTTLAFAGTPGSGIDYEVHRLFSPSEKRRALVAAARRIFPHGFNPIRDETLVSHNWLSDGSFERWTTSTNLTQWTETTVTATQTTTSPYYKHGANSCGLSTLAGSIAQGITVWDDLKRLAGKSVTFTAQGWSDTASSLRLSIYDGTTTTYSSYHDGDSTWTKNNTPLSVEVKISDNPTEITFSILHDVAAATDYVDDARVILSGTCPRLYIGHLGLAQNIPTQVLIETTDYDLTEPWERLTGVRYDPTNGYMFLPETVSPDYRLRILGKGYLDFLVSGVSSTAWTATIALDSPQTDILIARAALYLYTEMVQPNFTQGTREKYIEMMGFWKQEYTERCNQYRMESPSATINWGV